MQIYMVSETTSVSIFATWIKNCENALIALFLFLFFQKKENSKRRKEEHNLSRKSKDKKVLSRSTIL